MSPMTIVVVRDVPAGAWGEVASAPAAVEGLAVSGVAGAAAAV